MASKFLREYKVVVVGGGGVGKTTFVIRGYFVPEYDPTIEDSYRKQAVVDDEVALLDILDTAGQQEYTAMREQYMRTCEGMIIMYCISNRESFDETLLFCQQLLRVKDRDYFPMLLVGHRSDLHNEREISSQEGMALAAQFGCGFLEASTKDDYNVGRAFFDIVREIRRVNKCSYPSHISLPLLPPPVPQIHRKRLNFSKTLSLSSVKGFFKSSRPDWNLNPEAKAIRQQTLNRMLIQYARTNDKRRLRKVLDSGADVNAQPGMEGNALHAAAAVGHLDIVNVLIKGGVALNARESRGNTALHLAALEGHVETVKMLLRRGVPVDTKCGMYGTALIAACTRGHTKVARVLLQHGADVSASGGPFGSSFHAAAMIGQPDMVVLLHDAGAEIDSRGVGNSTALQIASFAGHVEVAHILLDRHAGINLEGGKYGRALDAAINQGHFDIIDILIRRGASQTSLQEGVTPLPQDPGNISQEVIFPTHVVGQIHPRKTTMPLVSMDHQMPKIGQGSLPASHQQEAADCGGDPINTRNSVAQHFSVPHRSHLGSPCADPLETANRENVPLGHYHYKTANEIPFKWIRHLGGGAFGIVDEVALAGGTGHMATTYARKTLKNTGAEHVYRMIRDEIDLLQRLRHRHVVTVIATYSISTKFAIIMAPVADTDLQNLLASGRPEKKMLRWFGCLAAGLAYMHSENIRHRDIKPANILIKGDNVLFTDFGLAKDFSQDNATSSIGTANATPMYRAPEVAAEKPRGRPSDVFSLGCVFLEMATVLLESSTLTLQTLYENIKMNGARAYHARPSEVLKFMLRLYGSGGWDGKEHIHLPLECCFAMLYPDPQRRIAAQALAEIIQNVEPGLPSTKICVGECCALSSQLRQTRPQIFRVKLNYDRVTGLLISNDSWDEVAQSLKYTAAKTDGDHEDE